MKKLFTLIELIVVIVILGILAAIVIPNIGNFQKEAETTAVISNIRNLQTSVDMYALENNGDLPAVSGEPTEYIPLPLDFKELKPDFTRTTPKGDIHYWVDYKGKVWASYIDSPKNVREGSNPLELLWDDEEGATHYRVYKVLNSSVSSSVVNSQTKLEFITEVEDRDGTSYTSTEKGTFVVSSVDENGFETAPAGTGYKGYEKYIASPTTEEVVPEGWIPIYNSNDLNAIRSNLSGHYILMNNIDLSVSPYNQGEGWIPIGDNINAFTGKLDGNGYAIENLYIVSDKYNRFGLFGESQGAELKNIGLTNVNVRNNFSDGGWYGQTGSLVGLATQGTKIINSYSTGSVTSGIAQSYTGGLAGHTVLSEIRNSYSTAKVTNLGSNGTGGLTGRLYNSTIENVYSTGLVYGKSSSETGGLIGELGLSTVISSYWDISTSNQISSAGNLGTGRTTTDMKKKSLYLNWDFESIWTIEEGIDYPRLKAFE